MLKLEAINQNVDVIKRRENYLKLSLEPNFQNRQLNNQACLEFN